MSLLYRARLFANKLLAPVGLAIDRTPKTKWSWGNPTLTTQVGRFSIQAPQQILRERSILSNSDYMGQLAVVASLLKKKYPNLSAIDIGASIGDTACIIKSSEDIPLLCIEGDDYTFGFLEKNIRQFQNITAHLLFLGGESGEMAATFEKSGWNTTIKPDKSGVAQKIKIVSLDDFLATQSNVTNYKLVKIDTEGFDCSIIRGATKFIQQVHPVITFEYNRDNMEAIGEKGLDTLSMLAGFGYSQAVFHDCNGRFFSAAPMSDTVFIRDLHDYADGKHGAIYYFDLTIFHENDGDIAQTFIKTERRRRAG